MLRAGWWLNSTGKVSGPGSTVVGDEGEQRLAQEGVTVRCLQRADGSVPDDATEPNLVAYCGRAY
jgi:hypothetical protein